MTGASSLDAVKRKIKFLQEQADCAEEKSERLQRELIAERSVRAKVSIFFPNSHAADRLLGSPFLFFLVGRTPLPPLEMEPRLGEDLGAW